MPKVKELGVTVLPQQFAPNEIGGGAACNRTFCATGTTCSDCTTQAFSICGTTPCRPTSAVVAAPAPCTDCTTQAFSICGGTQCTDCTTQAFSICGTTWQGCTDCTTQAFSICGTTPGPCVGCTRIISFCNNPSFVACRLGSRFPTILDVTTPCGGSFVDPTGIRQGGGLRREDIAQIKAALQTQLQLIEEQEKALGPQTTEEIDAREKELAAELDQLKTRRAELKKK